MKKDRVYPLIGWLGIILLVILASNAKASKETNHSQRGLLGLTGTPTAEAFLPQIYLQVPTATFTPTPTATPSATPTQPPALTGLIDITYIDYNVPGSAEPTEYVEIENKDKVSIQLQNWSLRDNENHIFTFPFFVMLPGQVCRIYTNYSLGLCGFNYGSNSPIWNNSGDTAYLRDASGTLIDEYSYTYP